MTADNVRPLPDQRWPRFDIGAIDETGTDAAPDYEWHIPGFLEPQTRLVLAGDEAVGKSLLLQQIMVRLAAGLPIVEGAAAARPLRVVVIDTELHERTIRRRLVPMARHARLPRGQLYYLLASSGLDLTNDNDALELTRIVGAAKPDFIAIDSLYRAFDGDPDDPRVIGKLQRRLDDLRVQTGAALALCAHFRKRSSDGKYTRTLDDIAGSRLMKAWPEIVLDVTRDKLRVLKDREGMAPEITLERRAPGEWETDPDGWPFTLTDAAPRDQHKAWQGHTLAQTALREFLATSNDPLTTNQVEKGVKDLRATRSEKSFQRTVLLAALGELEDQKHVTSNPGPRGSRLWTLTPTGLEATSTTDSRKPRTSQNQSEPVAGETAPDATPLPYGGGGSGNQSSDQFPTPGTSQENEQW